MLSIDRYEDAIARQWANLASPGTWLDGAQRVAVAAATRAARLGEPLDTELDDAIVEAATVFGADPAAPRARWVADLERRGVTPETYVEILSICSRLAAIDTFLFGVGHPVRRLPDPVGGEPSRERIPEARIDGGFAPTVGRAFPTTAVSALPGEQDVLFDLHGALYLSLAKMAQLEIVKDLDRRQLELVAARTSLLNDCFF